MCSGYRAPCAIDFTLVSLLVERGDLDTAIAIQSPAVEWACDAECTAIECKVYWRALYMEVIFFATSTSRSVTLPPTS